MSNPFGGHGASEVVYTGFGDGIGGMWLWCIHDVARHGSCEDDSAGARVGDYVSTDLSEMIHPKHSAA